MFDQSFDALIEHGRWRQRLFAQQWPRLVFARGACFGVVVFVVGQVAPLAERGQVLVAVVRRIMVQMSDGENDAHLVGVHRLKGGLVAVGSMPARSAFSKAPHALFRSPNDDAVGGLASLAAVAIAGEDARPDDALPLAAVEVSQVGSDGHVITNRLQLLQAPEDDALGAKRHSRRRFSVLLQQP